ncbi:MAG: hypothetical protein IKY81_05555 [Methanocorpusculum sp.]|nr:hypothetical protein [Methanocorpusculum sp.]
MHAEKPHIFLTGEVQVGKSFLLQKVIKELDVPLTGFLTKWGEQNIDGSSTLYLSQVNGNLKTIVAERRTAKRFKLTVFPKEFATVGRACLENPAGLVIMDELGRFESGVPEFCNAVFSILDSDIPVFGVVRDMDVDFLNAVRRHPKTEVIRVTKENRNELFLPLLKKIGEILIRSTAAREEE